MSQTRALHPQLERVQRLALITGVAGLVLCAVGWFLDPTQFFHAYLFAYMFWMGLALGSFAITLLNQLVGGGWGFAIRRIQEAAAMTLPLMLVLFVPIVVDLLAGPSHLYEWAHPDVVARDPILQSKSAYLDISFFLVRMLLYFAIWIGLAYLLNRWSLEQDRTDDPVLTDRLRLLARVGLVAYVLTMTFAAFDWSMSLEPHWFSSIYGVLFIAGQGLSSLAFAIVMAALLSRYEPLDDVITADHFNDLGNLMLAFVMFWTYINLSQYLIIWSGNIPEEVTWYLRRTHGGWEWVIRLVLAFQFVVPFLLLLSRRRKRAIPALARLAAMIIVVHLVELLWQIAPSLHDTVGSLSWIYIVAPIGVGGIWVAALAWLLQRRPLVPLHDPRDPRLQEAVGHGH
jgi:hypothetical protein